MSNEDRAARTAYGQNRHDEEQVAEDSNSMCSEAGAKISGQALAVDAHVEAC